MVRFSRLIRKIFPSKEKKNKRKFSPIPLTLINSHLIKRKKEEKSLNSYSLLKEKTIFVINTFCFFFCFKNIKIIKKWNIGKKVRKKNI